jgi:hypothetical protein
MLWKRKEYFPDCQIHVWVRKYIFMLMYIQCVLLNVVCSLLHIEKVCHLLFVIILLYMYLAQNVKLEEFTTHLTTQPSINQGTMP